jgi:type II secretory pathway component GspD/PulD (secretin)
MKSLLHIVLCLLGLAAGIAAHAQSLEIINLKHRTAEEVIPVLQPLVESGGSLSGKDYQLFVRASSANVAQLRNAIAAIDKQARQFMVSVRRGSRQEMERAGVAASATLRTGNGEVSVNERGRSQSGVSVRATDSSAQREDNGVSSVLVLEGGAAFISTGESVPIVTAVVGFDRRGPWVAGATEYRDLQSGFLAKPRIAGERIIIDIEQQNEQRAERNSQQIQTQRLVTQVSARPDEWVRLGGVEESGSSEQRGIANRSYSTNSDEQSVWVKVEVMQD